MLENAFITDNAIKKFDTLVPIVRVIGSTTRKMAKSHRQIMVAFR